MNEIYDVVPNIISSKDLDYLSDMFNWNYGAYKATNSAIGSINDDDIRNILSQASNTFYDILQDILNILRDGGKYE